MIRLRLFGRCRIYHDPVTPVLRAPAPQQFVKGRLRVSAVLKFRFKRKPI